MPSLPPPRTTELFYGGAWHNISGSMRETSPVTITRGVSAEGNQPDPMAASAVLDNRSGDYSPRNPHSALYGLIGRNTPWRFSVDAGGPWAELSGTHDALVTPGTGMAITGDLDLRVDITQTREGPVRHVAGRFAATGSQRSWALSITFDSHLELQWSSTGGAVRTVTSTESVPQVLARRTVLRATLDVNNGSAGHTVRFFYGPPGMAGPWREIGDPIVTAGTTSVWGGTAQLEFGSVPDITWQGLGGRAHALQLRDGIDGTILVDLDVATRGTPGASTVTDAAGRVWTVRDEAVLSNRHVRMVGEIPAWPPERDLSGADRTVAIAPAGIMRRLGVGNKPLDSALRRYIVGNPAVIDCWPMTDGPQSQWAASLMGGNPLMPLGDSGDHMQWGKGDVGDWLEPVAAITRETVGAFKVDLERAAAAESGWVVDCLRSGNGVDAAMTIIDYGAGSLADPRVHWTLVNQGFPEPDSLFLFADVYADDTVDSYTLTMIPGVGLQDGQPHQLRLDASHSGGSTTWFLYLDGEYLDGGIEAFYARPPRSITYEWNETFAANTTDLSLGYLTYWGADAPFSDEVYTAYRGFIGERAGTRVLRVAAEQGVPATMYGREEDSTLLGVQRPEKFLDTLTTIAKTDLGYVLEERDALALVYRGRHTLYNQAPVAVLDWADGVIAAPFKPVDDDKLTRNEITVKRDGGVESTVVLETGPMSVLDPPDGVGRYDAAHTLSLAADDQTGEHAYWRMHLGTHDGLRYTKVTVNLGNPRAYALVDQLYRADVGDILRLENLPAEYGGGSTDLLIRGYTEEIGASGWNLTFTCDPGAPWTVGVVDNPVLGRADTDGTELAAAVTSSQTLLPIVVTTGPEWITSAVHPAEFPFGVRFGGEEATATAITGTAEDAFGRTVASGWGTADSGQAWTVEGGAAGDYSVGSGAGRHSIATKNEFRITSATVPTPDVDLRVDFALAQPPTGNSAYVYACLRRADDSHMYFARVQIGPDGAMYLNLRKRNGAETILGSGYTTSYTYTAGTWYTLRVAMTGSTITGKVWLRSATEPSDWQLTATDTDLTAAESIALRTFLASAATNTLPVVVSFDNLYVGPQAMTVTRAVNGITKAHTAGTGLRLATPSIVAL